MKKARPFTKKRWRARWVNGCAMGWGHGKIATKVQLTDRPYGDKLSPTGEVLLRSALTYAVGVDAGKVNSTKPFQGLPILSHKLRPNLLEHLLINGYFVFVFLARMLNATLNATTQMTHRWMSARVKRGKKKNNG